MPPGERLPELDLDAVVGQGGHNSQAQCGMSFQSPIRCEDTPVRIEKPLSLERTGSNSVGGDADNIVLNYRSSSSSVVIECISSDRGRQRSREGISNRTDSYRYSPRRLAAEFLEVVMETSLEWTLHQKVAMEFI